MKKNVWIIMLLFIVSSLSMEIFAQENLSATFTYKTFSAIVEKYEKMPSVDVDRTRMKDSNTKKEVDIIKITFRNDTTLFKEFITALKEYEEKNNAKPEARYYIRTSSSYSINSGEQNIENSIHISLPINEENSSE